MRECGVSTRAGGKCRRTVNPPQTVCWWHDAARAEERRRAASRGGKGKANREVQALRLRLQELTEQVISGELETPRGAVANQLISTQLKLLEYERRLRELENLERRLEELEEAAEHKPADNERWRAWG